MSSTRKPTSNSRPEPARARGNGDRSIPLPSPDLVIQKSLDLDRIVANEPVRAREALRHLFDGGTLLLHPRPEGYYVAESRFLPLALFRVDLGDRTAESTKAQPLSGPSLVKSHLLSTVSCAGRI